MKKQKLLRVSFPCPESHGGEGTPRTCVPVHLSPPFSHPPMLSLTGGFLASYELPVTGSSLPAKAALLSGWPWEQETRSPACLRGSGFAPPQPQDRPQRSESSLTLPPPLSCAPPPWACPPPSRLFLALRQEEEGLALRCEFPPWGWAAWGPLLHSDSGPAVSPGREQRRTLTGPSGRGAWQRGASVRWVSLWEWGLRSHVRAPASGSGALSSGPCPGDLPLAAAQARGRTVWAQLLWGGLRAVPPPLRGWSWGGTSEWGDVGQQLTGPGLSSLGATGASGRRHTPLPDTVTVEDLSCPGDQAQGSPSGEGFLAESLPSPGSGGPPGLLTHRRRCCAWWRRRGTSPFWARSPASPGVRSSSHGRSSTCEGRARPEGACEPSWAGPGAAWGAQGPVGLRGRGVKPQLPRCPQLPPGCSPPAGLPAHQSVLSTGQPEPPTPQ